MQSEEGRVLGAEDNHFSGGTQILPIQIFTVYQVQRRNKAVMDNAVSQSSKCHSLVSEPWLPSRG